MKKPTHGGPRPNAGRPLESTEAAVNGTLRLYPSTWGLLAKLAKLSGKSRREVIAEALELYELHRTGRNSSGDRTR